MQKSHKNVNIPVRNEIINEAIVLNNIDENISDNVDKTLSNTDNLENILNSGGLACIIDNQDEPPFATFNVSVTYINNSLLGSNNTHK